MDDVLPDLTDLQVEGHEHARRIVRVLRRLQHQTDRLNARRAAELGLAPIDMIALTALAYVRSSTPTRLSRELGLSTGAMTALLDRLEAAGMVERRPNPADRRSSLLCTTATSRAVMGALYTEYLQAVDTAIEDVPEAGEPALLRALTGIADRVEETFGPTAGS